VTTAAGQAAVSADIRDFIRTQHPDTHLGDTEDIFARGFVSSLFAMQLVLFLEQHFAIQIPNTELTLDNLRTVAAMAELVGRCRAGS
jgi:methoxymalonate biosynthesis acyl carrier protein